MLVVNLVSEIMFHSLVSFFLTAYNEYVDSNILSNACQPGHVQPGLPGAGRYRSTIKIGIEKRGPL